jgi:hypothetical protein
MAAADVVDFFWEWQRRHRDSRTSALAELALDKCEEMLMWGKWDGFGYWHAVYLRERERLSGRAS